jgi:hypothetical protein
VKISPSRHALRLTRGCRERQNWKFNKLWTNSIAPRNWPSPRPDWNRRQQKQQSPTSLRCLSSLLFSPGAGSEPCPETALPETHNPFDSSLAQTPNATRASTVVINLQQRPSLQVPRTSEVQHTRLTPSEPSNMYIRGALPCCVSPPLPIHRPVFTWHNDSTRRLSPPRWQPLKTREETSWSSTVGTDFLIRRASPEYVDLPRQPGLPVAAASGFARLSDHAKSKRDSVWALDSE